MALKHRGNSLIDLTSSAPIAKADPVPPVRVRAKYHGDDCFCEACADLRAAMNIYLEAKRLYNKHGF